MQGETTEWGLVSSPVIPRAEGPSSEMGSETGFGMRSGISGAGGRACVAGFPGVRASAGCSAEPSDCRPWAAFGEAGFSADADYTPFATARISIVTIPHPHQPHPHQPSLFSVELRTARWADLVEWYRDVLGLTVLLRVVDDQYALLAAGDTRLAIMGRAAPRGAERPLEPGFRDARPRRRSWPPGRRSHHSAPMASRGVPRTDRHRPRWQPPPAVLVGPERSWLIRRPCRS